MNMGMSVEEQDKWNAVQYRMSEEGIDYCFEHYSDFKEIEDEKFHELRLKFIESMFNLRNYVNEKCSEEVDEEVDDVCEHPFKQVVSGDDGMFCIKCQKYISIF
jgi:hypothetical protein